MDTYKCKKSIKRKKINIKLNYIWKGGKGRDGGMGLKLCLRCFVSSKKMQDFKPWKMLTVLKLVCRCQLFQCVGY